MQFAELIETNRLRPAAFLAAQKVEAESATVANREVVAANTTFRIHLVSHGFPPLGSNVSRISLAAFLGEDQENAALHPHRS
jgi:hypothetical protein